MRRVLLLSLVCLFIALHAKPSPGDPTPRPELALQIGHAGGVSRVALSPDGTMAASAEFDAGTVKIWDTRSGDVLRTFREPGISFTRGLRFSRDGLLLAVLLDRGIKLWNTRTGALSRFLPHFFGSYYDSEIAFSPDGRWLARNASDYGKGTEVQLIDLQTGEVERHILLGGTGAGRCSLLFSSDSKTLTGLRPEDGLIRTWNVTTGEQQATVTVDSKGAGQPEFSLDGTMVAFARTPGNVPEAVACDVRTGKTLRKLSNKQNGFASLSLSPDGNMLATTSADHALKLWNTRSGELLQTVTLANPDALIATAFSTDGKTLVAGASNGSVLIYDMAKPTAPILVRTLRGRNDMMLGVAFSADQVAILSESVTSEENDVQLREWDAKTGALLRSKAKKSFSLHATTLSPDGTMLARAVGGFEDENTGSVQLLDAKTGAVIRDLADATSTSSLAFINDGKTLAGGVIGKNSIRLWDVKSGALRQNVEIKTNFPGSETFVCASPDGKLLAAAEAMGTMVLWDSHRDTFQEPLKTFTHDGIPSVVTAIAFSPDSKTLAVARIGDTVLLDAATGKTVRILEEHGGYVFGVAFSPDGRCLVTGGDSTVKVWNPKTGRLLVTLYNFPRDSAKPGEAEDYLVITPEGYYAGSAAADRYVRFRLGDTLYPAESFQTRYYRPELVQKALAGEELPPVGDFKGAFPPVAKLGLAPTDKSLPDSLNVTLAATDDSEVKNVAFFVNGARVDAKPLTADSRPLTADARALTADAKGLTAEARPLTADSRPIPEAHKFLRRYTAVLPLPPGAKNIKVQAIAFDDDGLQSARDELLFTRDAAAATTGKLLGLCVGVSQYQDARLNLKFADADAKALGESLAAQRGIYSEARVGILSSQKATAQGVKGALDNLIATATRNDTVFLSLSGHGWRDDDRNFYFATYEVNRNDVAKTALPWTEITSRLTQLSQKSKRVIVLLDACHSGSAATNEELVKVTLSANAGVLVFASSRGSEVSLESADWAHGAFTKALIEAIEGKAAPDEKRVTTIDFIAYVSRRVKALTEDQQHPQVPFLQDFDTDAALVARP